MNRGTRSFNNRGNASQIVLPNMRYKKVLQRIPMIDSCGNRTERVIVHYVLAK